MKKTSKRSILVIVITLLIVTTGFLVYRYNQPMRIEPDPDWEATIASLDVTQETFFIQSGKARLEADLLVIRGGSQIKPAVVFVTGSSSNIYQAYAPEFIKTFVMDVFLPSDMADLLVNKRGMSQSGGNWMHNDLQGRADDVHAAQQWR